MVDALNEAVVAAASHFDGAPTLLEKDLEKYLMRSPFLEGTVAGQRSIDLECWERNPGPVDLSLSDVNNPYFVELKSGEGTLGNCAWDMVKLAAALAERKADSAFLVAATSLDDWNRAGGGGELLDSRAWDADGLLSRYAGWFARWRRERPNYPRMVVWRWEVSNEDQVLTEHGAGSPRLFTIGEKPWLIRVAEIFVEEPHFVPISYAPTLRKPPATRPTAVDPDIYPLVNEMKAESRKGEPPERYRVGTGEGFAVDTELGRTLITAEGLTREMAGDEASDVAADAGTRFQSGAAARLWLEAAKVVEPSAPEVFRVSGHSGLGGSWQLEKAGGGVRYSINRLGQDDVLGEAKVGPASWNGFWRELDRIGAWDWRCLYKPDSTVTDGYGWGVAIVMGGRELISSGYMAFPDRGAVSYGPTPSWDDFVQGLTDLIGGVRLD